MKIVKLEAENVKRLKAVSIEPSDALVLVEGRNAQGKTSVLDAIAWALGGKRLVQGKPIRDGEEKAEVRIDLGELSVRRTWSSAGSTVEVSSKKKGRLRSPQAVLDALLGEISFDPLAFTRMLPKDRVSYLLSVVDVDIDLAAYASQKEEFYLDRREVNRRLKEKEATLKSFEPKPDLVLEPVDVSALSTKLEEALENNAEIDRLERRADMMTDAIEELKENLHREEVHLAEVEVALAKKAKADVDPIREELRTADETNEKIRAEKARRDLARGIECDREKSDKLTEALWNLEEEKARALAAAKMPVEGLSFDSDDVLFDGIPFSQASGAERLRISLGIAMAENPDLRVIRITDGSLLDDENLATIESMAKDEDYQVWIERVGESGSPVAVVIEDGEIKTETKGVPF